MENNTNCPAQSQALDLYKKLMATLGDLQDRGLGNSQYADRLRDEMDSVWNQLTEVDIHILNGWIE